MAYWKKEDVLGMIGGIQSFFTEERLERYWQGLGGVPFAFYDEQTVFLVNHPCPPDGFQPMSGMEQVYLGPWSNQFNANTNINFAGEEMGIIGLNDVDPTTSFAKIAALTAHEMFHAYQVKNNLINYNELTFFQYRFTKENLAYRVEEREELLRAVYATELESCLGHLRKFCGWRERRRELLGDLLQYELGVESMEGTATYVEYQVFKDLSGWPDEFILAQYCQTLAGYPKNLQQFRQSCFSPGFALCLLLDQLRPKWRQEVESTKELIYELLREQVVEGFSDPYAEVGQKARKDVTIDQLKKAGTKGTTEEPVVLDWSRAEVVLARAEEKRKQELDQFWQTPGYRVVVRGLLQVRGFDPMNITILEGQLLHRRILLLHHEHGELMIQGQSLATTVVDNVMQVSEVTFFVSEEPESIGDVVKIEGVGELSGMLVQEKEVFYITV